MLLLTGVQADTANRAGRLVDLVADMYEQGPNARSNTAEEALIFLVKKSQITNYIMYHIWSWDISHHSASDRLFS